MTTDSEGSSTNVEGQEVNTRAAAHGKSTTPSLTHVQPPVITSLAVAAYTLVCSDCRHVYQDRHP